MCVHREAQARSLALRDQALSGKPTATATAAVAGDATDAMKQPEDAPADDAVQAVRNPSLPRTAVLQKIAKSPALFKQAALHPGLAVSV